jgi:hypothetical protein
VRAEGASLKIGPSTGTFEVGGLVDVSFLVDTGGEYINAVQADILFPADKLQVVNPVASTSFISLWVTTPSYSNTDGTIHFQGGLPNPGIKTSAGVISTVTFRVRAAGKATLRYAPSSRVLRNDGEGTNILTSTGTADYVFKIPPPAGPVVSSPTHPDTNVWYNNPQIQIQWEATDGAKGYSFLLDQSSRTVPDEAIDTSALAVTVQAAGDGIWYFHIRARTESWGGVTTYPIQIDATPPAAFQPKFDKSTVTIEDQPTLRFLTSDAASGIDHYEIKQASVTDSGSTSSTLFVEASSPYTFSKLPEGSFEFIVRAFDRAGNSTDGTVKLTVVKGGLPFYALVPLLRNPLVANGVLVLLGLATLGLIVALIRRRLRPHSTFQHDLLAMEKDAAKKAELLQSELGELRRAEKMVASDLGTATGKPVAATPQPTSPAATPIPPPAILRPPTLGLPPKPPVP